MLSCLLQSSCRCKFPYSGPKSILYSMHKSLRFLTFENCRALTGLCYGHFRGGLRVGAIRRRELGRDDLAGGSRRSRVIGSQSIESPGTCDCMRDSRLRPRRMPSSARSCTRSTSDSGLSQELSSDATAMRRCPPLSTY